MTCYSGIDWSGFQVSRTVNVIQQFLEHDHQFFNHCADACACFSELLVSPAGFDFRQHDEIFRTAGQKNNSNVI